jgi:DNA mismatch repair protein PMS2
LGLFAPMPVRLADLQKNAKREFAKAITLLQGYALVAHLDGGTGAARPKGKGVRWNVTSTGVKGGCVHQGLRKVLA